jgi:hypothetical protein
MLFLDALIKGILIILYKDVSTGCCVKRAFTIAFRRKQDQILRGLTFLHTVTLCLLLSLS